MITSPCLFIPCAFPTLTCLPYSCAVSHLVLQSGMLLLPLFISSNYKHIQVSAQPTPMDKFSISFVGFLLLLLLLISLTDFCSIHKL